MSSPTATTLDRARIKELIAREERVMDERTPKSKRALRAR